MHAIISYSTFGSKVDREPLEHLVELLRGGFLRQIDWTVSKCGSDRVGVFDIRRGNADELLENIPKIEWPDKWSVQVWTKNECDDLWHPINLSDAFL